MTEEFVTKSTLIYLKNIGHEIIAYDFPQSGTGRVLHSSSDSNTTIPDIISIYGNDCYIFENKNRFYKKDFEKLNEFKISGKFNKSLFKLLKLDGINLKTVVALPKITTLTENTIKAFQLVDEVYFVDNAGEVFKY